MTVWIIYLLFAENGSPIYVGATRNLKRRLKEHKTAFGFKPRAFLLEDGCDGSWREAEVKWIERFRLHGFDLRNKVSGGNGAYFLSEESREKVSAAGRGKKKPEGFGATLSALTKGVPHKWSEGGLANARKGQFKPGQGQHPKASQSNRDRCSAFWAPISQAERSVMMTEKNKAAWSKRTPEQRSAIGKKVAASRLRNSLARTAETAV